MRIKCTTLGYHSSKYFCTYCNKSVSLEEDNICENNIISTKYYTILPSFEDIKNTFLNFLGQSEHKKCEY